jgi:ribosomal protein L3 glutamine methyltransferase
VAPVSRRRARPRTLGAAIAAAARAFAKAKLALGHGTADYGDEAAFLIGETLGLSFDALRARLGRAPTDAEQAKIDAIVAARISTRKPAPYLVKRAYIQGIPFYVDERVIVPRSFIGELLLGDTLVGSPAFIADPDRVTRVLDLCTGSGCLAIIAARLFPNAAVDAVELDPGALEVARINVDQHGLAGRVALHRGDLFAPLPNVRYDLIISNPPYVDAAGMAALPAEFRHEPALALDGGGDGLDLVRRIVAQAADWLTPGGALLCEVGRGRAAVERAFPRLNFFWLDTELSSGEVFWIAARDLTATT